jgi:hypothetical protein
MKTMNPPHDALGLSVVVLGIALTVCGLLHGESQRRSCHLIRFERDEGYHTGAIDGSAGGWKLLQGHARIVRDEKDEAGQCLETQPGKPYASVHFQGERVSQNGVTHCEIRVRPSASPLETSEEFMDLDGAVLGFFADEKGGSATFHAYHALPGDQGYWVATGVSAALDASGMTQEWIRIGIRQNPATATWDLEIGGEQVLAEIGNAGTQAAGAIQVWLLGHATHANRFDDLLISPVAPASLRMDEARRQLQPLRPGMGDSEHLNRTGARRVGRKESFECRRRHHVPMPDGLTKAASRNFDFDVDIIEGATQHGKSSDGDAQNSRKLLLYSPKYDDVGNPLPLQTRIQCDTELSEGVELSKIHWVITELPDPADRKPLKVIAHGNFKSGFTQIAVIPSQWANKATQVCVGTDLVIRQSP